MLNTMFQSGGLGIHSQYDENDMSQAGIAELLKSMEANEGVTDVSQLQGASALQPQSLEASVISLLYDESYFQAMKRIPKQKEYSTLVEYTVRDSYGLVNTGGFMQQSENPRQADPDFKRKTADIKYLRELWSISSVLSASRTITDAEMEAVDASTIRLLTKCEVGFFFANSSHIAEEWDGIDAIIEQRAVNDPDVVIDLQGAGFTESLLKRACKEIADRHGLANDMYLSYEAQNQIDNLLGSPDNQRYQQNQGSLTFDLGYIIPGFKATFAKGGRVTFINDFFIRPELESVPQIPNNLGALVEGSTSDQAPATPTFILADVAKPGGTTSYWTATSVAPAAVAYKYRIASENRHGLSKAAAIVSVTPTTGGINSVKITITDNSTQNFAEAYRIYREIKTATGTIRLMKRVPATAGGVTVFEDLNADLPGTSVAYLGDFNSQGADGPQRTVKFKELAPLHKTRYATIGPYLWGACNYYATPIFYAPQKFIKFKNIGVGQF